MTVEVDTVDKSTKFFYMLSKLVASFQFLIGINFIVTIYQRTSDYNLYYLNNYVMNQNC